MAGVRAVASGPEILVEASVAETSKAPVAETRKQHPVVLDFENLQKLGNGGVEATAFGGEFFCRKFPDVCCRSIRILEKGFGLESAIRNQSDYAKSAYAEFMAHLVKMSDLYCNLFKRGSTPIAKAAAKIESVKT